MEPYLGEIRMFAGTFAPLNWAICNGNLISISQYEALYALIGTTYGGNGVTTFGLPDLRGRVIVNRGTSATNTNYPLGLKAGAETVTLTTATLPAHNHTVTVSSQAATTISNNGNFLAAPADPTTNNKTVLFYMPSDAAGLNEQALLPTTLNTVGGNMPHENRMPYLSVNFIISLQGVFPSAQ